MQSVSEHARRRFLPLKARAGQRRRAILSLAVSNRIPNASGVPRAGRNCRLQSPQNLAEGSTSATRIIGSRDLIGALFWGYAAASLMANILSSFDCRFPASEQ